MGGWRGLSEEVTFENQVMSRGQVSILGRGNSKGKGPEAGMSLVCPRNSEEEGVLRESGRRRGWGGFLGHREESGVYPRSHSSVVVGTRCELIIC